MLEKFKNSRKISSLPRIRTECRIPSSLNQGIRKKAMRINKRLKLKKEAQGENKVPKRPRSREKEAREEDKQESVKAAPKRVKKCEQEARMLFRRPEAG